MNHLPSPLDMTVHNLPRPDANGDPERTAKGRWRMLLVLLVCAAPVIASYFTYYVIRPSNVKSFGQLVQPQRPMPALTATDLQGRRVQLPSLRGQWLLLSVASGHCDQSCQNHLYIQRQLRETLGREKDRVDWGWLISDDAPLEPKLQARLLDPALQAQGFWALRVGEPGLTAWLEPAAAPDSLISNASQALLHKASQPPLPASLYLIDPQGNYMMRFPADLTLEQTRKVRSDLERLLRASNSWDKAGRIAPH